MIRIQTKLLIFFMILVLLMNSVAFYLYNSTQKSINQYNDILQRFFLLNEVSQRTNSTYQLLNAYLLDKSPEILEEYQGNRTILLELPNRLSERSENQNNYLTVKNYRNMIQSFVEENDIVLQEFHGQNINAYSHHLVESLKISRFIQETTLRLINEELTGYQQFYADLNKKNTYFQSMVVSIFASTVLLSSLFSFWFANGITRPISLLSTAAKEISQGNFAGEDVKTGTKDELRFLTDTFNNMRSNIRRLIQEMKQKSELDKLLKEMELKSLQSQINPHFLFNTLNTVAKTAYLEGANRTSELIESISALLRYNLGNLDHPTTLKEEVTVVKEYFFIQQARFGERVDFHMKIDESCTSIPLPALTLQPIVENAFIHGIESYEAGAKIDLVIFHNDENIVVEVKDNGVGMDEHTRKSMLSPEIEPVGKSKGHSTGIGLRNVIKRLELFYRREGIVEIESQAGQGTTVRLILPDTNGSREGNTVD